MRPSLAATATRFAGFQLLALAASMGASVVNARLLGPERYGIWASATIVLGFMPFLAFGVDHGASQEIPLWRGSCRDEEAARVRCVYLTFALLVASLSSSAVVVFTLLVKLDAMMAWSLRVVAAIGFVASVGRWAVIVLKADHCFAWAGFAEGLEPLSRLLSCPVVYWLGLPGVWVGSLLGAIATALAAWRGDPRPIRLEWNWPVIARLSRFGLPIMAVSIVQILSTSGDKMLILGALGTSWVGIYALGRSFSLVLFASGGVIGPVVYPRIAEAYGRTGDIKSLRELTLMPVVALGAGIPLLLGYIWFGLDIVVSRVLPRFQAGIPSARVLFVAVAVYVVSGTCSYLLLAVERQVLLLMLFGSSVAVGLSLEYAALRLGMGLEGVAIGVVLSNILYSVALIMAALRLFGSSKTEQVGRITQAILPIVFAWGVCITLGSSVASLRHVSLTEDIVAAAFKGTVVALASLPGLIWSFKRLRLPWRSVVLLRSPR